MLDYVFVGGSYTATPAINSPGVIGGIFGRVGFLSVNAGVEQRFDPDETIVVVGLIDSF